MHNATFGGFRDQDESQSAVTPARFYVLASGGGNWLIYREGRMNPIEALHGKSAAVQSASVLARQEAPSEVLIEQKDGSFKLLQTFSQPSGALAA